MSSKAVRDAVEAYLHANWSATPILAEINDVAEAPADLTPFVTHDYEAYSEEALSYGLCSFSETGVIILTVWIPSGTGLQVGIDHAEALRVLFRKKDLGGNVVCGTVSPPDSYGSSDGSWFNVTVEASYDYFYHG